MKTSQVNLRFLALFSSSRIQRASKSSVKNEDYVPKTFAEMFPNYSKNWVQATSNKLIQPQHVAPDSVKLVLWRCPHCTHEFKKRVDHYVSTGGLCPSCKKKPNLSSAVNLPAKETRAASSHKAKEVKSNAPVASKEKAIKSMADGDYLTSGDTRNLQPMLAKSFDKEFNKINFNSKNKTERLFISPKLDGIRCVVAYDKSSGNLLFFSRAGTRFECCDDLIEPHLRRLFEEDEHLVLDGELYNDFSNQKKIRNVVEKSKKQQDGDVFGANLTQLMHGKSKQDKNEDVSFEQLVSAIRTTKAKRTEVVREKQKMLQYHIFDIMYSSSFPSGKNEQGRVYPFSERYALLGNLLDRVNAYNKKHLKSLYDPTVLQRVPAFPVESKQQIDDALRTAMSVGFEGLMVRRENVIANESKGRTVVSKAKSKVKRGAAQVNTGSSDKLVFGGYEYGKRSSALLKYKKMQDDEFVIVGAVEGKGKLKGHLGAFVCCSNKNKDLTFTVSPATNEGHKKELWKTWEKHYKGKALTVQYQDITADGIPRFPVGKCVRGAANGSDWI